MQYWNEVLKPDDPLDPNLVKALIASESGFDPKALATKKDSNSARGLMQIANESRKLLGGDRARTKEKADNLKERFDNFYEELKKCGKP